MPRGKKEQTGPVLSKTITLPAPVFTKIFEVQESMNADFSTTLLRLLRLGIQVYEDQVRKI